MIQEDHVIARLDALSRVMNVGALVLGPGGRLEFASPVACGLLGVESLEALGERWETLKRPLLGDERDLPSEDAPLRRVANVKLQDDERSLRVEVYRLSDEGPGYLALLKDRRTVDMLETDLVLASQMRSLAHVYRVLAHDLRAPLNAMQLTLDLLASSLSDAVAADKPAAGERRHRHLAILREELARLDRIVRTMLEQQEALGAVPGTFDLREIIREVARVVLPQARRQRVEVELALPDHAVTATGYRDRIKQAVLNLALRGVEAMPDGGRLKLGASVEGDAVVTTVEDTGPGLPPALLDDLYQIHYTSRKSPSGIGLYMTRLVVESHGGEIVDEGRAGDGARFRLTLPRGWNDAVPAAR